MKIGILTLPLNYNYGGILQAYALQTYLQRAGHDVSLIDRRKRVFFPRVLAGVIKRAAVKYILGKEIVVLNRTRELQIEEIGRNTGKFIEQHIRRTAPVYSARELAQVVAKDGFEILIVGSDQVWRPEYSPSPANYFLDFLPVETSVKRLAYAASFGVDDLIWPASQIRNCGIWLQRFDGVGVREQSGVELCEKYFGVKASHVIDPTLLLCPDDYLQLTGQENTAGGGLFVYLLDNTPEKQKAVDRALAYTGLNPFRLEMISPDYSQKNIQSTRCVEDWLDAFRKAEYVITDSFHGCVFSILFNKPFIVYGNPERGMARFTSLLDLFDLKNRLITSPQEMDKQMATAPIVWERINVLLEDKRKLAATFFEKHL